MKVVFLQIIVYLLQDTYASFFDSIPLFCPSTINMKNEYDLHLSAVGQTAKRQVVERLYAQKDIWPKDFWLKTQKKGINDRLVLWPKDI